MQSGEIGQQCPGKFEVSIVTENDRFLHSLASGGVCLHPTDTIPGLTFDPSNILGLKKVINIKQRPAQQSLVHLVGSIEQAFEFWQPLPHFWRRVLGVLWPGPISVVWKVRSSAKDEFCAIFGDTIAFRLPRLDSSAAWYSEILAKAPRPLPSSSCNVSGDMPASNWQDAVTFCHRHAPDVYIPKVDVADVGCLHVPSTVLKIHEDTSFEVVREGAISKDAVRKALEVVS